MAAQAHQMCASLRNNLAVIGCAVLLCVMGMAASLAAPTFPALTGRIVDQAGIINTETKVAIEPKLQALEEKSGIQFVVATIKSLEGGDIETYANQLFRTWKLGETKNNNGVLLIVAPNERKLRIEVGYGLEGTLTDALSKIVIANAIAPRFKAGDFGGGIARGVDDVITILTTDASEWAKRPQIRAEDNSSQLDPAVFFIAIFLLIFVIAMMNRSGGAQQGRWVQRGKKRVFIPSNSTVPASKGYWTGGSSSSGWGGGSSSGSSWGGGSSSDGGFSGGGGSSGGGGASGDW